MSQDIQLFLSLPTGIPSEKCGGYSFILNPLREKWIEACFYKDASKDSFLNCLKPIDFSCVLWQHCMYKWFGIRFKEGPAVTIFGVDHFIQKWLFSWYMLHRVLFLNKLFIKCFPLFLVSSDPLLLPWLSMDWIIQYFTLHVCISRM